MVFSIDDSFDDDVAEFYDELSDEEITELIKAEEDEMRREEDSEE